jgi:hypothetical protein
MPDPYALPTFPNPPLQGTTPVEGTYRQIQADPEPIPCPPDDEEDDK